MNQGKYVFSQIMGLVSSTSFQTIVNRHSGDYKVRDFSCWKQFSCMAFGQLTHRESISDTILCLKANANKMYHIGIGKYPYDQVPICNTVIKAYAIGFQLCGNSSCTLLIGWLAIRVNTSFNQINGLILCNLHVPINEYNNALLLAAS